MYASAVCGNNFHFKPWIGMTTTAWSKAHVADGIDCAQIMCGDYETGDEYLTDTIESRPKVSERSCCASVVWNTQICG